MLNDQDRERVRQAVAEAESLSRGEIFCVLAETSSDYAEVPLAWAAGAALLAPAILLLTGIGAPALPFAADWTAAHAGAGADAATRAALVATLALQGLLFVVVALVGSIPAVRVWLAPSGLKRRRVRQHAQELFLAKNIHATRDRTGVLILVSWREHRVELVADDGIDAKVEPGQWDQAVAALVAGLRRGDPAGGFVAAVGLCGAVLARHFPVDGTDNPNELPDAIVEIPRL